MFFAHVSNVPRQKSKVEALPLARKTLKRLLVELKVVEVSNQVVE